MKAAKDSEAAWTIGLILLAISLTAALLCPGIARPEDAWLKEFEAVCSQTDDAMDMTKEQLTQLVERCDRLRPVIEKQDEITKKVYLKRLENCRSLYKFVLESKDKP